MRQGCWYMGYRPSVGSVVSPSLAGGNLQALQNQKKLLEEQLKNLQDSLRNIEKRLSEIQEQA
jgi:chaperonin cofactor prefoldin